MTTAEQAANQTGRLPQAAFPSAAKERKRLALAFEDPDRPAPAGSCHARLKIEIWGRVPHEIILLRGAMRKDRFRVLVDGKLWRECGKTKLAKLIA